MKITLLLKSYPWLLSMRFFFQVIFYNITALHTFSLDISYCLHKGYWTVSLKIFASLISHSSKVKSIFRSLLFSLFCNTPVFLLRQVNLHRLNLQDLALMFSLFKTLFKKCSQTFFLTANSSVRKQFPNMLHTLGYNQYFY